MHDIFIVEGWTPDKPVRFVREPGYSLDRYQDLLKEQIRSINDSIINLGITSTRGYKPIAAEHINVSRLSTTSNDEPLIITETDLGADYQEAYFTYPSAKGEFREENKYWRTFLNKLDLIKRTILHAIKIVVLNFMLLSSKIFLLPPLKRYIAPLFGLKTEINPVLKKEFHEASVVYTDNIGWLLSHMLYLKSPIIFCRRLNLKFDPNIYRNVLFTIRSALQKTAGEDTIDNRLIIHDHLFDDGYTLKAIRGLLNKNDTVVIRVNNLPAEILDWRDKTKVEEGYYLCKEMPAEWLVDYVPVEPSTGWPKISVITVSYNQAEFIEDCLDSILDQAYPNLEYIVVDGQSTDGTIDILERYRNRLDHLLIEPDSGQSNALNKAFKLATGEIMTWICSDDMLAQEALFHIGKAYAENEVDLIVGGCKIIAEKGEVIHHHHTSIPLDKNYLLSLGDMLNFMGSWQTGQYFYQPEMFFSKKIWQNSGAHLKEHLYYAMDYDMFLRMGMAGAEILHISRMIGVSRQHNKQKTQYRTKEYLPQIKMIMEEYLEMVNATISTAN